MKQLTSRRAVRRARGERGSVILLMSVSAMVSLIVMGLVIDIGRQSVNARANQSIADLAALAAGADLTDGNYAAACHDAIQYLNVNAPGLTAIDANGFCAQSGNDVSKTTCSAQQ